MLEYEIKRMVNNDIEYCKHEWDEYSFDVEKMAVLFDKMMFRYEKIIKNFDEDMKVVLAYKTDSDAGDVYRHNVKLIIKKLEEFRDNGYKNDGLGAENNPEHDILPYDANEFDSARLFLEQSEQLSESQKSEAIQKIEEIEEICMSDNKPSYKWEQLKPYVVWLTGKNLIIASHIMPLFMLVK